MTRVLAMGVSVAVGRAASKACGAVLRLQRAQEPVPTGSRALVKTWVTVALATPYPPAGPLPVVPAKTVVNTPPPESTSGPPELPGRTPPRSGVSRRETGPLP